MRAPPDGVPGAEEAAAMSLGYARILSEPRDALGRTVGEMPGEVADVFHRVASTRLDLVVDERQRAARLAGAQ